MTRRWPGATKHRANMMRRPLKWRVWSRLLRTQRLLAIPIPQTSCGASLFLREAEFSTAQTDLAEKETILSARSAELQAAGSQRDAAQAQVTGYEAALAALDAAPGQLEDARAQIAQQGKTLAEGEAQLAAGEAEYQKQAACCARLKKEIASGKTSSP